MKKENIIQFVCFSTQLPAKDFALKWENHMQNQMSRPGVLHSLIETEMKMPYNFISIHEDGDNDYGFALLNGKRTEMIPGQKIKVSQAGGYIEMADDTIVSEKPGDVKVLAFISHHENEISFYRELKPYRSLVIYQAYYENCKYSFILEFLISAKESPDLIHQLKTRAGLEVAVYKQALIPHL